jgi:hypothetical protein
MNVAKTIKMQEIRHIHGRLYFFVLEANESFITVTQRHLLTIHVTERQRRCYSVLPLDDDDNDVAVTASCR